MAFERTQQLLQFAVALGDLQGIGVDQGLLEGKQMLVAPVALQRCGDLGLFGLDAAIPQPSERSAIALTRDDGADDGLLL